MSKFHFKGPGLKVKVTVAFFSLPVHKVLKMSYCDHPVSVLLSTISLNEISS